MPIDGRQKIELSYEALWNKKTKSIERKFVSRFPFPIFGSIEPGELAYLNF